MNDWRPVLARARAERDVGVLVDAIPYARLIGVSGHHEDGQWLFRLSAQDSNLGNTVLRAIHGGVLGGFMELSASLHLLIATDIETLPRIVDFSVDYLRPALQRETLACCEVVRQGRSLVNVGVVCWQEQRDSPVATARAHFVVRAAQHD